MWSSLAAGSSRASERSWGSFGRRSAVEEAVVHVSIPDDIEMRRQPRLADHGRSVAANKHGPTFLKDVVVIKGVEDRGVDDGSFIDRHLPVILTERLQLR